MTPERVVKRVFVKRIPLGDCLVSTYSVGSHGYAQVGWQEGARVRMALVHRVVWEAEHGPIPRGWTIDHVCRNKRCALLDHLRLLTNVENGRDNGQSRKTVCPKGHPYDGENLILETTRTGVTRRCRTCRREQRRRRR